MVILAGMLACGGCREQPPERKYIAVSVTATKINLDTGLVTVQWQDPRTKQIQRQSGQVTAETEIFINGISAGLADLRVGDRAVVTVYPTVTGGREQWVVTRVSVERETSFTLTKPIPQPPQPESKPAE